MSNITLNREQQAFLSLMFETRDVEHAVERLNLMIIEASGDTKDIMIYLTRLIKKYRERK